MQCKVLILIIAKQFNVIYFVIIIKNINCYYKKPYYFMGVNKV